MSLSDEIQPLSDWTGHIPDGDIIKIEKIREALNKFYNWVYRDESPEYTMIKASDIISKIKEIMGDKLI